MNRDTFNTGVLHGVFAAAVFFAGGASTATATVQSDPLRYAKPAVEIVSAADGSIGGTRYAKPLNQILGDAYLADNPLRFANADISLAPSADATIDAKLTAYAGSVLGTEAQVTATGIGIIDALAVDSYVESTMSAEGERLPYAHPRPINVRSLLNTDAARITKYRVNFVATQANMNGDARVRSLANTPMGFGQYHVTGAFDVSAGWVTRPAQAYMETEGYSATAGGHRVSFQQQAFATDCQTESTPTVTRGGVAYHYAASWSEVESAVVIDPVRLATQFVSLSVSSSLHPTAFTRKAGSAHIDCESDFRAYKTPVLAEYSDFEAGVAVTTDPVRTVPVAVEFSADATLDEYLLCYTSGYFTAGSAAVVTPTAHRNIPESLDLDMTHDFIAHPSREANALAGMDGVIELVSNDLKIRPAHVDALLAWAELQTAGVRLVIPKDQYGEVVAEAAFKPYRVVRPSVFSEALLELEPVATRVTFAQAQPIGAVMGLTSFLRAQSRSAPSDRVLAEARDDRTVGIARDNRTLEV